VCIPSTLTGTRNPRVRNEVRLEVEISKKRARAVIVVRFDSTSQSSRAASALQSLDRNSAAIFCVSSRGAKS
jgi:hypothetical protein